MLGHLLCVCVCARCDTRTGTTWVLQSALAQFRSSQQSYWETGRSLQSSAGCLCTSRPPSSCGRTPRPPPAVRSPPHSAVGRAPPRGIWHTHTHTMVWMLGPVISATPLKASQAFSAVLICWFEGQSWVKTRFYNRKWRNQIMANWKWNEGQLKSPVNSIVKY